jgi:oligopeptide/dipeptide ABC transporter ATP-binding protein
MSTRIAVMYLGEVVEQGLTRPVIDTPRHPYTLSLMSAVPGRPEPGSARQKRIILKGDLPSPRRVPSGCRFHTRCPFVMDMCRTEKPEAFTAADGTTATCHLHTHGPKLAGRSVAELPVPQGAAMEVPVSVP